MKPATKARRALLATLLAGATIASTGCSSGGFSLASMNPFSSSTPTVGTQQPTESIAEAANGTRNQINSLGSTAKSAFGKTTDAVAGVFRGKDVAQGDATDPLSLSNKPKSVGPEVFVANGQLWESTGDFNKAMESYTKALESEPNNPPALTSIARLHFRQGNHKVASDFFQRAIAKSPKDAGLHNDLGLTLSKLGDYAGATQSLEKALEIAPGTSRYANNLASVKFEAGDSGSAYQVLSSNNKPAVAHFNMAYLHFKNGQMSEARGHLNQALTSKTEAAADPAVQRAVERSQDMLAQIDGSMSPIAQAAPQATIAGGQFLGAPSAKVQQTSQSGSTPAAVAPAAPTAPAMSAITLPPSVAPTPPAKPTPSAVTPTAPAPSAKLPSAIKPSAVTPSAVTPSAAAPTAVAPAPTTWGKASASSSQTSRPMPTKPTAEAPAASGNGPSVPFAMPGGFNP